MGPKSFKIPFWGVLKKRQKNAPQKSGQPSKKGSKKYEVFDAKGGPDSGGVSGVVSGSLRGAFCMIFHQFFNRFSSFFSEKLRPFPIDFVPRCLNGISKGRGNSTHFLRFPITPQSLVAMSSASSGCKGSGGDTPHGVFDNN